MRRREFIKLLGGAATTWPLAAHAQQSGQLPTIGFVGSGTPSSYGPWVTAFTQRLRELGWIENRTVAIEIRWAEGRAERYDEIAAEVVRLNVDAILRNTRDSCGQTSDIGCSYRFCRDKRPRGPRGGRELGATGW